MKLFISLLFCISAATASCQKYVLGIYSNYVPPITLNNAVIVCDGNSLTEGYLATNSSFAYPERMATMSPFNSNGSTIYNKGVGGQTTLQMSSDASTDIDPLYNPSETSILIAWEIGNDLYFNGDADEAYQNFVDYCNARKAVGWTVYICTLPAREHSVTNGGVTPAGDSDAAYNTKRLYINNLLVTNYLSFSDALIDLANVDGLSTYNTTYFNADKVHFNDAGYLLIATVIAEALQNAE